MTRVRTLAGAMKKPKPHSPKLPATPAQRESNLHIRLLPEEMKAFRAAAAKRALTVSVWVRMLCRREAGLDRD